MTGHEQKILTRANWWFIDMREVVDKVVDWQPQPRAIERNSPAIESLTPQPKDIN